MSSISKRTKIFFIILLVLGFATRFAYFGYPNQVVFDEVYFGKFVSSYVNGQFFFDIHPPLGKLLIAAVANAAHVNTNYDFKNISEVYPDNSYIFMRILPMIFGSLLPLLLFLVARELKFSDEASFFAGLLAVFENSLVVQSRFILLDMLLIVFGFLALLLYLKHRNTESQRPRKRIMLFALAVFFASCALSIKWTGVSYLGLIGLFELVDFVRFKKWRSFGSWVSKELLLVVIPVVIYISVFAVHFGLLYKSGAGDAYMSPEFQKTLVGSQYHDQTGVQPLSFFGKFIEEQKVMYSAQQQVALKTHPYASQWYTWPILKRPVFYWLNSDAGNGREAKIYLLGNPGIYWLSTCAIIILFGFLAYQVYRAIISKRQSTEKKGAGAGMSDALFAAIFIGIGYAANMLPFMGVTRSMFLYHYLSALVFAIFALAYVVDRIKSSGLRFSMYVWILAVVVLMFFYFSPLTYGMPFSNQLLQSRIWLSSWN